MNSDELQIRGRDKLIFSRSLSILPSDHTLYPRHRVGHQAQRGRDATGETDGSLRGKGSILTAGSSRVPLSRCRSDDNLIRTSISNSRPSQVHNNPPVGYNVLLSGCNVIHTTVIISVMILNTHLVQHLKHRQTKRKYTLFRQ
jgi:hypothetical protein